MPHRRLDDAGRAVIELANTIAHEYELEYVGSEHILLAILRHNRSVAATALRNLGLNEAQVRAQIDELVQRSKEDTWVFGRLPGTPHYLNMIEKAMEIAEQLEAQKISPEHLLLALFHDRESTARRALVTLGVTQKKCRDEVLKSLSGK